jgi:glycosyltransferase involved in cell wall biosynthesis
MIHLLEQRGHRCRVYVIRGDTSQSPMRMQALVHAWFKPIAAPVLHLHSEMAPADATIATSWETAYVVRASAAAPVRSYFVQDFEPAFFPAGAQAQLAEDTYRFGFKAICAGRWLEGLVREKYGMEARSFRLGVDPAEYYPELHVRPDRRRVYAYVRPHTARRGFELVGLTLARLHQEMPEVEIHLAGAELEPSDMPFPFVGHGILTPAALRSLFSTCDVALCPSFTNYSLMPQELAACGCPVVEVDVESTRAAYPPGAVLLAQPTVEGLTSALVQLLTDEPRRLAHVEAGLAYARSVTWESAAAEVDAALRHFAGDTGAAPSAQLTSA